MTRRKHHGQPWLEDEIPPAPAGARTYDDLPMFAPVLPAARNTDPDTSNEGVRDVLPRAASQQQKLLMAYAAHPMGLTNEEAGQHAGLAHLGTCFWKRCGELAKEGFITFTGSSRKASTGSYQRVHAITDKGRRALEGS